jgi:hypothetical protein
VIRFSISVIREGALGLRKAGGDLADGASVGLGGLRVALCQAQVAQGGVQVFQHARPADRLPQAQRFVQIFPRQRSFTQGQARQPAQPVSLDSRLAAAAG